MLRTYLAFLGADQKAYEADGDKKNPNNAADSYMTLLGYFNSLRELGGSRRIVEDEVNTRLTGYVNRKRRGQKEGLFANRAIAYEVVELTSRVPTNQAAERQRVFFNRVERRPAPWTFDPVLRANKFTNAYRASDRVSQYLIRRVIYRNDLPSDAGDVSRLMQRRLVKKRRPSFNKR